MISNIKWFSILLLATFYVWCILIPIGCMTEIFNNDKLKLWIVERIYNLDCRVYNIMVKQNYGKYSTRQEMCKQIDEFNNIIYDYKIDF